MNNNEQITTKGAGAMEQTHERMLTMQEAMDFLTDKGFPCRSRSTFYKMLENFNIPYTNINPGGTNEVRRFPMAGLEDFLFEQGLIDTKARS